jgi:metal-responsive CopG/Arc/MetJ family transcriptional regulator
MQTRTSSVRKVTISLPPGLLEFTDRQAVQLKISRSEIISRALAQVKATEEERLAAEGYRFYSQEASEFAATSAHAFAEVLDHAS